MLPALVASFHRWCTHTAAAQDASPTPGIWEGSRTVSNSFVRLTSAQEMDDNYLDEFSSGDLNMYDICNKRLTTFV